MEINPNNSVNAKVRGIETTPRTGQVKREREDAPKEHAAQLNGDSDDRISLSDASKHAVAELTSPTTANRDNAAADLSDKEAAQLARQTAEQLGQTSAGISNQALQNAVDLFT
jgi:hypothetical protein